MKRDVSLYIQDILQNMGDAEEFVQGMSYAQFVADKKTFNAVVRAIEVVGEASKHIPDNLRRQYPDLPWKEMAGMRDKVIHMYFAVDHEAVWLVVQERIPTLKRLIEGILRDLKAEKP